MSSDNKSLDKEKILETLKKVNDPDLKKDLVSLNMIKEVRVDGNDVYVNVQLTTPACPLKDVIQNDVINAIKADFPQIGKIEVDLSSDVKKDPSLGELKMPEGVKNIIAIGSGKGGVGKSTVALNTAIALSKLGAKVAILDADIYGPSIPTMLGIKAAGGVPVENEKILPVEKFGIKVMSIGFIIEEGTPIIWRGPLLGRALDQFLFDVVWGDIDYMIIDLPPGTGDIQLSLAQKIKLTGGVIVTTPQNVALMDAQKAAQMFVELKVPLLGIVENMSYYVCPQCGHQAHIFSTEGGQDLAKKFHKPVLGQIPLVDSIREGSDIGTPAAASEESSPEQEAFLQIAGNLSKEVSILNAQVSG